ncbi:MAG: diaminopimelate epimerase [Deltaproteobacteria bacterium]|nr:diaminopimelate epimerase [Deltaproteobacteria bacterium]
MIEFFKMSGSGNDFILIDNRDQSLAVPDVVEFVKAVCERKVSVGADGLIIIENSPRADFRWRFFNADGSEVDMCGNGGRCAARFAFIKGIAGEKMSFETGAGLIDAEVKDDVVKLRLTEPYDLKPEQQIAVEGQSLAVGSINTGVPHVVHYVEDIEPYDVFRVGRAIRYHEAYQPAGTNANFAKVDDRHAITVRTYERGVEDETLACGTGSVASVLISAVKGLVDSPVDVKVRSGETLTVHFRKTGDGFANVYLEGRVRVVYEGRLWEEAYGG